LLRRWKRKEKRNAITPPAKPNSGAYVGRKRGGVGWDRCRKERGKKKVDFNTAYFIHAYNPAFAR